MCDPPAVFFGGDIGDIGDIGDVGVIGDIGDVGPAGVVDAEIWVPQLSIWPL